MDHVWPSRSTRRTRRTAGRRTAARRLHDATAAHRLADMQALNARLTQAVALASVSVWRFDVATQRIEFNEYGYRTNGLTPEPGGVPIAVVRAGIHPDDREASKRAFDEALATNRVVELETRFRNSDGTYRHLLTRRVAERDADGRAVAIAGISIDRTQQIAEREHARTLAQRIDSVTRAAGVGLWSIDVVSGAVEWNERMFHIYGMPPGGPAPSLAEIVERCVHPEDRAFVLQQRQRAEHAGSQGVRFEFRIVRPDGAVRWLSSSSRRARAGDTLTAYGVTMDITESKLAEQALRDKASAEEASRAKSEFLSRMSHELRTPLNAVLGFAQLLLHDADDRLNTRQDGRVRNIHSAGLHLLALIDDVLDLASIESNTLKLEASPVSLQDAIDDVLRWTTPQAERAGVVVHAAPTAAWVCGDARRVRQVLANLLGNAIKYNRPGGEVWVACEPVAFEGADGWRLSVRDTGRGLSDAQRAHLFEPFNRLGAERDGIEGTGIGLTIVHHLVQWMGGAIEVESTPGRGSTFRVDLPAARQAAGRRTRDAGARGLAPAAATPLSVLYIEDNAVNVLLVEQMLAMRPHMTLLCAADGASGVALARAARPDVVLVDMQLPDFDGYEVLRRLQSEPALRGRPLIALSASAMPEDVTRALAAGFRDYWTKPIDFVQFLRGLDALALAAA